MSETENDPQLVPLRRNIPEIFQIFHNVQFNTVHHRKYVKELKKLFHKLDEEAFKDSFVNALHYTFTFGDANGNVDRVLQFVSSFCTALKDDDEFLEFIFRAIFDCVSIFGQNVRNRSCQLLGMILNGLGEDASLDDDLCDNILKTQLERLQDVKGAVRHRAVLTLQRLQNPTVENDPVTIAYNFHMSHDPSAAVRRSVIICLAKSSRNLLHVLERLCDIDESVRKAAFLHVSSINVTQLKVRQRVHILKVGLAERSPRVRRVVETALIPGWLGAYKGSVLDLLAAIRLDNLQGAKDSALVAKNLLQVLFKHQSKLELLEWLPIDPKLKLIPANQLNKESAWYWRHLVRHLHEIEDTDSLDLALPELITFVGYVRTLLESECPPIDKQQEYSKRQCILEELINIFPVYDMADEVGRIGLQNLLYDSLTGNVGQLDAEVIRAIIRSIDLIHTDVTKRIEYVTGIISEIHEPVEAVVQPQNFTPQESSETKMMRARLRVSLNEALEQQEEAVRSQDFSLAAKCKEKVDEVHKKLEELNLNLKNKLITVEPAVETVKEKQNDPATLNKCLLILNMLLDSPQITKLTPVLSSLFQNFEVMIFQNTEIRENALKTVALYSMLDEDFAKEHKAFFFSQFMDMSDDNLIITALKCVIDIMCIHGVKTFNLDTSDGNEEPINKSSKRRSSTFETTKNKSRPLSDITNNRSSNSSSDEEEEKEEICSPITHDTIIDLFLGFMNSECVQYREVVVEGFCRLLMAGRLKSSSLISRLLLLWFNPATEEEDTLRQLLGTFFPLFASHVETAQEQLEAAFIPTLETLANAPHNSPLDNVDHEMVLKFMIGLTLPSVSPTAHNIHSNLCVLIMNALERGSDLTEPMLCRALSLLTPPQTLDLCNDLLYSARKFIKTLINKQLCSRYVSKFLAVLAITIDNLEKPSASTCLDTLHEVNESEQMSITSEPKSGKRKSSESSHKKSIDSETMDIDSASPSESDSNQTKNDASSSPSSSPPRKIQAVSASEVAKRAIKRSAVKSRTPRITRSAAAVSTPQSATTSRSLRKTRNTPISAPNETPKPSKTTKKTRSVKALNKELEDVPNKKNSKKNVAKSTEEVQQNEKNVEMQSTISENVLEKSLTRNSLLENDSSDEETALFTIIHDEFDVVSVLQDDSSDESQKTSNVKSRPNITVLNSDSSDDLFSSDNEDLPIQKPNKKKSK